MRNGPILMSAPMVRAVLAGTKTQTRREFKTRNGGVHPNANDKPGMTQILRNCPYGQPGDRLWVREAFAIVPRTAYRCSEGVQQALRPDDDHDAAIYREGWTRSRGGLRWRPSIHMPRWASRLTLGVTGVRLERLQDISHDDACAEGIESQKGGAAACIERYRELWESLNGVGSWRENPWVWVITFEVLP